MFALIKAIEIKGVWEQYIMRKNRDTEWARTKERIDAKDLPIQKPTEPLPAIFDTVRRSGFTTTSKKSGVHDVNGAVREKRPIARIRREN